jgi:hypothetical protein
MAEEALHITPGADQRDMARVLDEASDVFVQSVKEIRLLGDELEQRFAQIEAARKVLDDEGVAMRATFDPPITAAFAKWRESVRVDAPVEVPSIIA